MLRFQSLDATSTDPQAVIWAYRGSDASEVAEDVPSDSDAFLRIPYDAGFSRHEIDQLITSVILPIAVASPGKRILIRDDDDENTLTAWFVSP